MYFSYEKTYFNEFHSTVLFDNKIISLRRAAVTSEISINMLLTLNISLVYKCHFYENPFFEIETYD